MSSTDTHDFRDAASAESLHLLADADHPDPRRLSCSVCVAVEGASPSRRARIGHVLNLGMLLGMAGFFGGAPLLLWGLGERGVLERAEWSVPLPAEAAIAIGVIGLLFGLWYLLLAGHRPVHGMLVRGAVAGREGSVLEPDEEGGALSIQIDDDATYHLNKLSADDHGLCVIDAESKRLRIEATRHQYVVRGEDVEALSPLLEKSTPVARIAFRVGEETLRLALYRAPGLLDLLAALGSDEGHPSSKLAKRIGEALGVEVTEAPEPAPSSPAPSSDPPSS